MFVTGALVLLVAVVVNGDQGCWPCDNPYPEPWKCGGQLNLLPGETGSIWSPGYPNSYPKNTTCDWRIMATGSGALYHTSVGNFNLEAGNCHDKLRIDSVNICGTSFPKGLVTEGSMAFYEFKTDGVNEGSGFRINIRAGPLPTVSNTCGQDVRVDAGETAYFVSPNFPRKYPKGSNCAYTITGPASKRLEFSSATFSLGYDQKDYLYFTELVNGASQTIGNFTLNGINQLRSTTNQVNARFISTGDVNGAFLSYKFIVSVHADD